MAELMDIRKVQIGPKNLLARVRLADDAPLMTSEDLDGTARVYRLLPHIVEHACLGDAGETFRDAMGDTELAHLLEHVTVELLAQTDRAGDMPAGRTWVDEVEPRTYEIELSCPDDALVCAALSCGVWILDWAYNDGGSPAPDIKAIVRGLVNLVDGLEGQGEDLVVDYPPEPAPADEDAWDDEADEPAEEDEEPDASWLFAGRDAQDTAQPDAGEATTQASDLPRATESEPPAKPERPLWTPAPDVPTSAMPVRREAPAPVRDSAVEAQIDQIMASFAAPPASAVDAPQAPEVDTSGMTVALPLGPDGLPLDGEDESL